MNQLRWSRWRAAWSRRRGDEEGSTLVGLPIFCMIVAIVAVILFRFGIAADLRAGTQTAGDAAALAAAQETGNQIIQILAEMAAADPVAAEVTFPTPEELCGMVADGGVAAAAEDYAGRNDANVTGVERACMVVSVSVASNGGVPPLGGFGEEVGPSEAVAAAEVEVPGLPGASVIGILEMVAAGAELDVHLVE